MQYDYAPLQSGVSNIARAFAEAPRYEAQGMRDAATYESRLAQTMKSRAEADAIRQRQAWRPEYERNYMIGQTGLPGPQLEQAFRFVQTGKWETPQAPEWYTPEVQSKLANAMSVLALNMAGTGDSNASQLMGATGAGRETQMRDDIVRGTLEPDAMARALALQKASGIYEQNADGQVLNQYSGEYDASSPLAQANARAIGSGGGRSGTTSANVQFLNWIRDNVTGGDANRAWALYKESSSNPRELATRLYAEGLKNLETFTPGWGKLPEDQKEAMRQGLRAQVSRAVQEFGTNLLPSMQVQAPQAQPQQGGGQGGLQAGQVVDGYEFLGGNPNDPKAWRPAQ